METGDIFMIFVVVVFLSFFLFVGILFYSVAREPYSYDNDCLKDKAERICWEQGLHHLDNYIQWSRVEVSFKCVSNNREVDGKRFKFLESDLEGCKK